MLALPVVVGMVIRHRWPHLAARWGPHLQRVSLVALGALVGMILFVHRTNFERDLASVIAVAIPFYIMAMAAGWATGKAAGLIGADCFTLAVEFAARNLGITAVVGARVLGRTDFVLFAAVLFLVQTPILLGAVGARRLRQSRRVSQ